MSTPKATIKLALLSLRQEPVIFRSLSTRAVTALRTNSPGRSNALLGRKDGGGWISLIRKALAWAPPVVWALVLFALSEMRSVPSLGRSFLLVSDKAVHFALYLTLGALLALARRLSGSTAPHAALIAVGAAYGALDEWHQSFVPRRSPDVADWFADVAGVAVGYILLTVWVSRWSSDQTERNLE